MEPVLCESHRPQLGVSLSFSLHGEDWKDTSSQMYELGTNIAQICLRPLHNPISSQQPPPPIKKQLVIIREGFRKRQQHLVVHGQYVINLSRTIQTNQWALHYLIEDMRHTHAMGGMGVVVHMGKHGKLSLEAAFTNMIKSIQFVLQHTPSESILILETAAGQGTELLTSIPKNISRIVEFPTTTISYMSRR